MKHNSVFNLYVFSLQVILPSVVKILKKLIGK